MAYVYGDIPFFHCLVRREYTLDLKEGHGEFIPAVAYGVRCVRGHALWFQTMLLEPYGGCAFMVPIEALAWTREAPPVTDDMTYVQPWDVFSSDFGVCESRFTHRGAVNILPDRRRGQYRFTIDFVGSDLAEHPEQHKALHVCFIEGGTIGAFPNNRILWSDPAFWRTVEDLPRFASLSNEYRAEGNQDMFRQPAQDEPAARQHVNGHGADAG